MHKIILLVVVICCACFNNIAAREVTLTVDDVLERVAAHNADVRSSRSSLDAAVEDVTVAKSARLPRLNAALDLNYIGDGTILDRDFTHAMRDRLPHFGNSLTVSLYQPVYQGGAIDAGIEIAKFKAQLAEIGVSQQMDASSIEAISAYFSLLKMLNLRSVYEENIALTNRLIAQMTEHFNQGTALRNDITRYELRLSSLSYDLQSINNSISVLNNNLVSLLALDPDSQVRPAAVTSEPDLRDEPYWQSLTAKSSTDLLSIDKSRQIASAALKIERAALLPSVGIVIADQLLGPVTFEIPAINKNYNAWFAGLSVKYDISSLWTANKKIKQKRLEINHLDDNRYALSLALERRVHETFVAAVQARQMLATERVNVKLANENYDVVETRFQNGMALLTDMLDASTAKLDAETRQVNAHINLLLSYYQLKYISSSLK